VTQALNRVLWAFSNLVCTTTSERIDHWIKMHRSLARFSGPGGIAFPILGGLHHRYARV
jgi:hypothetical protein